jgi:HEAT repeat protein
MLNVRQLRGQIETLNSGDDAARRDAIAALKEMEGQVWVDAPSDVVQPLVKVLKRRLGQADQANGAKAYPRFRQDVAAVLGKIGAPAQVAVPELTALLAKGIPDCIREAAATALGNIGRPARPAVGALLEMLEPECRVQLAACVARALGEIGCADQHVRAALLQLWALPIRCENSRFQVAIALCKLHCDAYGLIETLTNTLAASGKSFARLAAAEALSWCSKDTPGVVPAFIVALHDEDEQVRAAATKALQHWHLSEPRAIAICCQQLPDCALARTALRKSGAEAISALIGTLESKNPDVREQAAQTIGAIGEPAAPAAGALAAVLKDKDGAVRLAAAKALWNITKQPDLVVPVLASLLKGNGLPPADDGELRRRFVQTVIEALGRIGPVAKNALPALKATMKDDNRLIRESAERALKAIGG